MLVDVVIYVFYVCSNVLAPRFDVVTYQYNVTTCAILFGLDVESEGVFALIQRPFFHVSTGVFPPFSRNTRWVPRHGTETLRCLECIPAGGCRRLDAMLLVAVAVPPLCPVVILVWDLERTMAIPCHCT
jgi:hypothetical protein